MYKPFLDAVHEALAPLRKRTYYARRSHNRGDYRLLNEAWRRYRHQHLTTPGEPIAWSGPPEDPNLWPFMYQDANDDPILEAVSEIHGVPHVRIDPDRYRK